SPLNAVPAARSARLATVMETMRGVLGDVLGNSVCAGVGNGDGVGVAAVVAESGRSLRSSRATVMDRSAIARATATLALSPATVRKESRFTNRVRSSPN